MVNYWGNMKYVYYVRFVNYEQKGINQRHTRNSCDMWLTQYYLAIPTYEKKKTFPICILESLEYLLVSRNNVINRYRYELVLSLWLHCWIWDHRGLLRISTDWKWTLTWLQSGDRDKLPVYSDVLSWTVFLLCFLANLVLWCVRSQVLFIRWSYIGTLKKKKSHPCPLIPAMPKYI